MPSWRTTGAVWINAGAAEVWLVEVIPTMAADDSADEPTFFRPGVGFQFPLMRRVSSLAIDRFLRAVDNRRQRARGLR